MAAQTKTASLFFAAAAYSAALAQGTTDVRSTGVCSPNVVSNSDSVTITVTCTDPAVGSKLSDILTKILKGNEGQDYINEKLDIILDLLGTDLKETRKALDALAEQHLQRRLTEAQQARLAALLRDAGKYELGFRHTRGNAESFQFLEQLERLIVDQAGWTSRPPQLLFPTRGEAYGIHVLVHPGPKSKGNRIEVPPGAGDLVRALREVGLEVGVIAVEGLKEGTFDLLVGLPPPASGSRTTTTATSSR